MRKQTGNPEDYKLTKIDRGLQKDGSIVLTGTDVKNAEAVARSNQVSDAAEYAVALEMNKDGAAKFAEATKKRSNQGEHRYLLRRCICNGSECQQ